MPSRDRRASGGRGEGSARAFQQRKQIENRSTDGDFGNGEASAARKSAVVRDVLLERLFPAHRNECALGEIFTFSALAPPSCRLRTRSRARWKGPEESFQMPQTEWKSVHALGIEWGGSVFGAGFGRLAGAAARPPGVLRTRSRAFRKALGASFALPSVPSR